MSNQPPKFDTPKPPHALSNHPLVLFQPQQATPAETRPALARPSSPGDMPSAEEIYWQVFLIQQMLLAAQAHSAETWTKPAQPLVKPARLGFAWQCLIAVVTAIGLGMATLALTASL
jgi:hypothetical protein